MGAESAETVRCCAGCAGTIGLEIMSGRGWAGVKREMILSSLCSSRC